MRGLVGQQGASAVILAIKLLLDAARTSCLLSMERTLSKKKAKFYFFVITRLDFFLNENQREVL